MTRKKTFRSPSTRSTRLGPDTVTGSALADAEEDEDAASGPLPDTSNEDAGGDDAQRHREPAPRSGRKNPLA